MKTYQKLATLINARNNCIASGNNDWRDNHESAIAAIMGKAPSGSGIDCGTIINLEDCSDKKMSFSFSYHYMNENGYYDGWYKYKLTVTPSLQFDIDLKITGSNRGEIKDYLYEIYEYWLNSEIEKEGE